MIPASPHPLLLPPLPLSFPPEPPPLCPAQPHAVDTIRNDIGNSAIHPFAQDITYNPFLKTATISESTYSYSITYGTDQQRKKTVLKNNNIIQETKIYSGRYEKLTTNSGTKELHYIPTPSGTVAAHIKTNGASGTTYFLLKDHLGSILKVVNSAGSTIEEHSYDAWGNHRLSSDWTLTDFSSALGIRGYTGHEMLPHFQLINMNGRMYDPVIGRFLAPDNYVQSPFNAQNYNRYSYALNNPLKYTDPDGEWILIGAIIGGINGYIMADATGHKGWSKVWYTLAGAAIGAATAGIGTAASSAGGVIAGGAAGGAFSGAAYGVMGGHAAGLSGGGLFGAGMNGLWKGALTGLVGSSVGGMIGGGWGALAGGASAGALGAALNGASGENIAKGALLGGVLGWGVYHAKLAYTYRSAGISGNMSQNYRQFAKMVAVTQRSIFWNREGRFIPNLQKGRWNASFLGEENQSTCNPSDYPDALFDYHTHQTKGFDHFSTIQEAIDAGFPMEHSDYGGTRQTLTALAMKGEIPEMTMCLGTREGNVHYLTHSGVTGTFNFNLSSVFTPYNILWSLSLFRNVTP